MRKRIRKAGRKLRAGQLASALRALTKPHHTETRIIDARRRVVDHLRSEHGNTVAYGPFKGMALPARSSWGNLDAAAKILGTYEAQISDALVRLSQPDGLLIDLGSADGYFAIGAVRSGLFARCICFERAEKGRAALKDAAERNGVADRIEIHGEATASDLVRPMPKPGHCVVLCDIEGGEFDILTEAVLGHFAECHILIELHGNLLPDGERKVAALLDRASVHFDASRLRSALPDIHGFRELDQFDDDHRLLAFSEGRDEAMEWLYLEPKDQATEEHHAS